MKTVISLCALLLSVIATQAHATGPFDGIYALNLSGDLVRYVTIYENNDGELISITHDTSPFESTWEALSGVRDGNNIQLNTILGTMDLVVDLSFNDDNSTGTATIVSCNGTGCLLPVGVALELVKIF